jgi:PAS domain S-box-containing protein
VKTVESLWARARDAFSAQALELTSPAVPRTLNGGLSITTRAIISAAAMAVGSALTLAVGPPVGVVFLFPALTIVGVAGGMELGLVALALVMILTNFAFRGASGWLLDGAAALQLAVGLAGRVLFRESRTWGVRHRSLLSTISAATTVSDGSGRIERPHPELARLLGLDWPDYAGTGWMQAIHPDDHPKVSPHNDGQPRRAEIRLRNSGSGDWRWYDLRATPLFDENGKVVEWISALTDIHQAKMAEEHQRLVIGEARHRLKNLITIIESLAKSSRPRSSAAVDDFLRKFSGRLHALSAASDLSLASQYSAIDTEEIVRATLAPFLELDSKRISFGGQKLALSEGTGGALAMGLHELATNAIKYGALSMPEGQVSFTWHVEDAGDDATIVMEWIENGAAQSAPPEREGYGGRVIKFIPSREKNGKVDVEFRPDGYYCRVSFLRPKKAAGAVR